jgi:hypothetical protein
MGFVNFVDVRGRSFFWAPLVGHVGRACRACGAFWVLISGSCIYGDWVMGYCHQTSGLSSLAGAEVHPAGPPV